MMSGTTSFSPNARANPRQSTNFRRKLVVSETARCKLIATQTWEPGLKPYCLSRCRPMEVTSKLSNCRYGVRDPPDFILANASQRPGPAWQLSGEHMKYCSASYQLNWTPTSDFQWPTVRDHNLCVAISIGGLCPETPVDFMRGSRPMLGAGYCATSVRVPVNRDRPS